MELHLQGEGRRRAEDAAKPGTLQDSTRNFIPLVRLRRRLVDTTIS
jgi:hypothetical protein